jgi:hypothetical protein
LSTWSPKIVDHAHSTLQFWTFNLGASLPAGALATRSYTALFLIDAACTLTTALVLPVNA